MARITVADQDEANRLQLLEDFERLKFYPWLEWMASAASLSVSDILTVLSHGVTEPLIREFRKDVAGSGARFVQNHRFLGLPSKLPARCSWKITGGQTNQFPPGKYCGTRNGAVRV